MDMKQLKMVERPISELKGYARNPRKNDEQVDRMIEASTSLASASLSWPSLTDWWWMGISGLKLQKRWAWKLCLSCWQTT